MKSSTAFVLAAASAGAGWFVRPLVEVARTGDGSAEASRRVHSGEQASQGASPSAVTAQAQADAAKALSSPLGFLESLNGQSTLLGRSKILSAVGAMSADGVREMAGKMRALGSSGTPAQWELMSAVYERWSELDVEGLLTEAVHRGMGDQAGYLGVSAAFRQLVKNDPDGAWKRAQDLGPLSYYAKRETLSGMGTSDPARALKLAGEDGQSRQDSYMVGSLMQAWVGKDRNAAIAAVEALPQGEFRTGVVSQIAQTFAAQDGTAALAWAAGLKNSAESSAVINSVLQRLATEDPKRVMAMADDPKFAQYRQTALASAVSAWGRRDFNAAFDFTLSSKSPSEQLTMLHALNENATPTQRRKLLDVADTLPPSVAKNIYQAALNDYYFGSKSDPQSILDRVSSPAMKEELTKDIIGNYGTSVKDGMELFAKLQPVSQTTQQASRLANRLAWSSPTEAMKWAEGLSSADLRKSAITSAVQTWSYSDPEAAGAKAASLTDPAQREAALRAVAGTWGGRNEQAALQWAESLPAADRSSALSSLVQNAMQSSPEQARKLYERFASGLDAEAAAKTENKGVARSLAASLTQNNPQEAIAWSQALAPGPAQNEAYAGIAEKWAAYDATAASQWLTALPQGDGRDLAADRLVSVIARDDPDSAWQWALSISDRGKRREAAARTLEAWKAYGAKDSALAALQSGGFTGDELVELQRKLD